jgi:hypothetical protein
MSLDFSRDFNAEDIAEWELYIAPLITDLPYSNATRLYFKLNAKCLFVVFLSFLKKRREKGKWKV